jgi:spore coat protein U-like protein
MVARPTGAPRPGPRQTACRRRARRGTRLGLRRMRWRDHRSQPAETETSQLTVTATVLSGCTLIGGTLDFGNYVSGQPGALDAAGQIGYVNCSGVLTFELDGGQSGDTSTLAA